MNVSQRSCTLEVGRITRCSFCWSACCFASSACSCRRGVGRNGREGVTAVFRVTRTAVHVFRVLVSGDTSVRS